jgi:hypothetical protein
VTTNILGATEKLATFLQKELFFFSFFEFCVCKLGIWHRIYQFSLVKKTATPPPINFLEN